MADAGMVLVRDGDGRYHLEHIGPQFGDTGNSNVNPFWVKMTKNAEKRMIRAAIIKGYEMAYRDVMGKSGVERHAISTMLFDRFKRMKAASDPEGWHGYATSSLSGIYSEPEHTPIPKETP